MENEPKQKFVRVSRNVYVNPERVYSVELLNGIVFVEFGTEHASIILKNQDIDDVIAYLNGEKEWEE